MRFKDAKGSLQQGSSENSLKTWEQDGIAVLLDIREELKRLNILAGDVRKARDGEWEQALRNAGLPDEGRSVPCVPETATDCANEWIKAAREEGRNAGALTVYGSSWMVCEKHQFLFGSDSCAYCKVEKQAREEGERKGRDEAYEAVLSDIDASWSLMPDEPTVEEIYHLIRDVEEAIRRRIDARVETTKKGEAK